MGKDYIVTHMGTFQLLLKNLSKNFNNNSFWFYKICATWELFQVLALFDLETQPLLKKIKNL